jgi:hypothetical protein
MAYCTVNVSKYIISKIDGGNYCLSNGQFTRHLQLNDMTYQQYYEKYITGIIEICKYCGRLKMFYQATNTYAATCGSPKCRGIVIKETKNNWTDEQREKDSINKRKVNAARTVEEKRNILEKVKKTNLEKFGTEFSFNSDELKAKAKQTKQLKYGNEKYNNSRKASNSRINRSDDEKLKTIKQRKATNLERYGVENPLLSQNFISKSNKGNSLVKTYTMPSGKIVGIMGYEPIALNILLKTYTENDIEVHDNFTHTCFEKIEYIAVNRHHLNYYPDIYIKSTNTIIEIKSKWWWDGNGSIKYKSRLENNLRKFRAAIINGYNYEVWLFENKYDYRIIHSEQDI